MNCEDYVDFEVAKLLEENGCGICSDHHYFTEDIKLKGDILVPKGVLTQMFLVSSEYDHIKIYAPLLCEVQKWLREKCDICVEVILRSDRGGWKFDIYRISDYCWLFEDFDFLTYEKALNEGIKEALKLIY